MTLLQALKKIKQLTRKIETTQGRVNRWCSYFNNEEPIYTDIKGMVQSVTDMQLEISRIRHAMHVVNCTTVVKYEGKETTLDQLLLETRVVIPATLATLKLLRRKEKGYQEEKDVKVVMQYDPSGRDKHIDILMDRSDSINDFLDENNKSIEIVL